MREDWWGEIFELNHKTQVAEFNFCLCEEQEQFPYEDCQERRSNMPIQVIFYDTYGYWTANCNSMLAIGWIKLEDRFLK